MTSIRRTEIVFVTIMLVFACGLRFIGIDFGQPDPRFAPTDIARDMIHENAPIHPDEFLYTTLPLRMIVTRQPNPKFFENPSFLINLNLVLYAVTGEGWDIDFAGWQGISQRRHAPFRLYFIGRGLSALGGLLAVAAVYATARRLAGRYAALTAGMLTAVALPLVQHSHYTTTSGIAAGFAALCTWAVVESGYRTRHQAILFIFAGIAAGIAAGSRYNAAAVGIVVFVGGIVQIRRHRASIGWVIAGWIALPAAFILTTPHIIFDTETWLRDFRYITSQYLAGTGIAFTTSSGWFYELRYLIGFGIGVPAAIVAIVGVLATFTRGHKRARLIVGILALYLIPYGVVVLNTARPGHSDQLLVPILPALALLVGLGAAALSARFTRGAPLIPVIVCAFPLVLSLQFVRLIDQPDTRYVMQAWIEAAVPHGAHIHLNGPYNVPLDEAHYTWTQNYGGDLQSPDAIRATGAEYMIVSDSWYHDTERSIEIVGQSYIDTERAYLSEFEALIVLAWIERPQLIGTDVMMHTATAWHHPGLTLYCLTADACAAVR